MAGQPAILILCKRREIYAASLRQLMCSKVMHIRAVRALFVAKIIVMLVVTSGAMIFARPARAQFRENAVYGRTIEAVVGGAAGYYDRGKTTGFQPTANIDFIARTRDLDFLAGFH